MTLPQMVRCKRKLLNRIGRNSILAADQQIFREILEREIERFLASKPVQIATLLEIWSKKHGNEMALALANEADASMTYPLDFRRIPQSTIYLHHAGLKSSGARIVCDLPDQLKMWHMLARDLIVAQHRPASHIGDWKGRGRDWQAAQIPAALTSPDQCVVSADIRTAFARVNVAALSELHYLPQDLIRRAIDFRSHRFVHRERRQQSESALEPNRNVDDALEMAPSGLMEGSPASNAIFSVLLDDLPDHLGEEIQTFVYCDNIILIAPDISSAQRAHTALVRYLSGHRAGPFEVRSEIFLPRHHVEHLGYTYWQYDGGPTEVGLSLQADKKLDEQINADAPDYESIILWLISSYRQCSPVMMEGYLRRVTDEIGFRSRTSE